MDLRLTQALGQVTWRNSSRILHHTIPSLVYSNSGGTRKYNEMEIESIAGHEILEIPFVPHEITVNEKSPVVCLESSSSVNLCCKTNNDADSPASTESEVKEAGSDDKAGCDHGFPGFGQPQICTNAEVNQTEVLTQFSNVLRHSPEEGESSLLCTDIQRASPESKPHKAEEAAVDLDESFSQMTPDIDSAGMGTLEILQTPFSLSCYESPANLPEDSGSHLELQSNKANAEACEVFEVRRDPMLNISPETHLLKVTQVPQDAYEGGTNDVHSQHVFSVETASEISVSALVEDQFSSITNQEIEALESEDISSEAGHFIPDTKKSLNETSVALESDFLLPNHYISTFDNFEDLSLSADAQDYAAPKEDETNSQDGSSMNPAQSKHISTSEISSENGTLMSDTPRDLHTGYGSLSASSCLEDGLANPDLAEISSYSGQEDPQTMSIVSDDSSDPEVPIPDGTCFAGDVDHDNQTGLNNKAIETVPQKELETISDPQESLLGTEECLSSEYCLQIQNQRQESPSETGSANSRTSSDESPPTQNGSVGVQSSPLDVFPSSITEIEALHAPYQEIFTSLNDHISESVLSKGLTDEEDFLNVSPESILPLSTSLHETPQANPEITPPLPPLPPTQWWMGKLVESTEMPSLAGSGNNSFNIQRDENTQNGSVQANEAQYPSEVSVTDGENHNFHIYTEESKATEEQSPSGVNGTSDTYMESKHKCLNRTPEDSFSLAESAQGLEADWRTEAMALEWFSQNLREHNNPHPAKLEEEEPQVDHPLEKPGQTKFRQTLRDNNSYNQNQKAGKLKRDEDTLVIGIDRSMLRKVSEGNRTHVGARVDENDSLLEIIRSKSFNLRPADASGRPNFQVAVPKTNLKVAAILEKANTLRQAMAGSDDEHDSDSWSE